MKNNILHLFHHKQNHQNLHNTYLNQEVETTLLELVINL
jgi:hypothetical protein